MALRQDAMNDCAPRLEAMKMFVWEDTDIGGGGKFGGTLCCMATDENAAREEIRAAFKADPTISGYDDMNRVICSDGSCAWDWLERDLSKPPQEKSVSLAFGGDW